MKRRRSRTTWCILGCRAPCERISRTTFEDSFVIESAMFPQFVDIGELSLPAKTVSAAHIAIATTTHSRAVRSVYVVRKARWTNHTKANAAMAAEPQGSKARRYSPSRRIA